MLYIFIFNETFMCPIFTYVGDIFPPLIISVLENIYVNADSS